MDISKDYSNYINTYKVSNPITSKYTKQDILKAIQFFQNLYESKKQELIESKEIYGIFDKKDKDLKVDKNMLEKLKL